MKGFSTTHKIDVTTRTIKDLLKCFENKTPSERALLTYKNISSLREYVLNKKNCGNKTHKIAVAILYTLQIIPYNLVLFETPNLQLSYSPLTKEFLVLSKDLEGFFGTRTNSEFIKPSIAELRKFIRKSKPIINAMPTNAWCSPTSTFGKKFINLLKLEDRVLHSNTLGQFNVKLSSEATYDLDKYLNQKCMPYLEKANKKYTLFFCRNAYGSDCLRKVKNPIEIFTNNQVSKVVILKIEQGKSAEEWDKLREKVNKWGFKEVFKTSISLEQFV